jgi:hypothetical protein
MINPVVFQAQVLDTIQHGAPGSPQGLSAFTGVGGDFENIPGNKVRAFIITSQRRSAINPTFDDLEFPHEVGKIKNLLKILLGRDDTLMIPYVAGGPDLDLRNPLGKVLIQYNPVAAMLLPADGGCASQIVRIELWFQDSPLYRYRDSWEAFPSQVPVVFAPVSKRSSSTVNKEIRILRGIEVEDIDEEEWKEFEGLMSLQESGSCAVSSRSNLASSATPTKSDSALSSSTQGLSTLQTILLTSSSGVSSTPQGVPASTGVPAATPTPVGPSTPSRAVSIIMKNTTEVGSSRTDSLLFLETLYRSQVDGCNDPWFHIHSELKHTDSVVDVITYPPWPEGRMPYSQRFLVENPIKDPTIRNCTYVGDGCVRADTPGFSKEGRGVNKRFLQCSTLSIHNKLIAR